MWDVKNRSPYAVARNWTRDKDGVHHWLVALKATFDIGPAGALSLADEQPPPSLETVYRGDPGRSSVVQDCELLGLKPTTELLVSGHAHAPKGRPTASVPVTVQCGPIQKSIVAFGARVYFEGPTGLATTDSAPFVTTPIVYEHAFGGWDDEDPDPSKQQLDERNPVGRGFGKAAKALANTPAHTLELASGGRGDGPAGLGPIDPSWLPRRPFAGTYDAAWVESKKPLLPDDYDPRFHLSAPADQQAPSYLRGGESVGVLNMTEEGRVAFPLPTIDVRMKTVFGRRRIEHVPSLTTVALDLDARTVQLLFQSSTRVVARDVDRLDFTEVAA